MYFLFDWANEPGVQKVLELMKTAMNIIRWIVPIGLIVMTSLDLFNKVLKPDDKESQKKIMNRAIAAIIVFFVPTIVSIVMKLVDVGKGETGGTSGGGTSQGGGSGGTTTVVDKPTKNELNITCPTTTYNVGDNFVIKASTNNNSDITWTLSDTTNVRITPNNNGTSALVEIKNYPNDGVFKLTVKGNSITKSCAISVKKPEITGNVTIVDCPTKDKVFKKGDQIVLHATGPNNFYGNLTWFIGEEKIYSYNVNDGGKEIVINILDYEPFGNGIFAVAAGGTTATCSVYIHQSPNIDGEVTINNCPYERVKVGSSFTLSTNNSVSSWGGQINSRYIEVIDNKNNTATIRVLEHFSDMLRLPISVRDNEGKMGTCSFYTAP